jgi:hypothetical protein
MIKCNVTVCGVIGRDASIRTNKEGKTFLVFPLRVMIPDTDGKTMPIEVDVSKDTAGKEVSKYRNGSRIEVSGTMYLKHRGDKLYFNLFINEIRTATADAKDTVKGELLCCNIAAGRFDWKKYCTPQPYCGQEICVIPLHCSYGQIGYTVYFPYSDMPEVEYDWEMNKLTIDKENWENYLQN